MLCGRDSISGREMERLIYVVVVVGLERTEVELANVDGLLRVLAAALATFEIAEKFLAHSSRRLSRIDFLEIGTGIQAPA